MILSYTPLEEAWDLSNEKPNSSAYNDVLNKKNEMNKIQNEIGTKYPKVSPSNSDGMYDSMTINLDGFNPSRIDIVISDTELIKYMQNISYKEQQALATNVLLNHFKNNPSLKINKNTQNIFKIPPNSSPNSTPNADENMKPYNPLTQSPNSSFLHSPNTLDDNQIEFYKTDSPNKNNNVMMYMILAMLCYLLYERFNCILKN